MTARHEICGVLFRPGGDVVMPWLLVAAGGALGAALRHMVQLWSLRLLGPGMPVGTFAVNVVGSFAMGLVIGWLTFRGGLGEGGRIFLATGLLGGFTTFSAFSLDAVNLWQRGDAGVAFAYVAASVILSIAALGAGLWLAKLTA